MSTALSGYDGEVHAGTWDAQVSEWQIDGEINEFDSTTTADAGWDDVSAATKKVTGSFKAFYRVSPNNPTGSTAGISMGAIINQLTLYIDKADAPNEFWQGKAIITKLSIGSKIKDGTAFTASFKSKGIWTIPS